MAFKYIIEKENENGSWESSTQELSLDQIRIGRGASADIHLQSPLVGLTHAVFKIVDSRLGIEDLGSSAGIRVNGKQVNVSELKAGDEIKLGDVSLVVTQDDGVWGVVRRISASQELIADDDQIAQRQAAALDISRYLPSFLFLSLFVAVLLGVFFLVFPLSGHNELSWSSGPLAPAHQMIEKDCQACHGAPFEQVKDEKCLACHKLSDHSPNLHLVTDAHKDMNLRCAQCHMDHNGPHALRASDSKQCTQCHAQITALRPETSQLDIGSFQTHPEFAVSIAKKGDAKDTVRVRLDDPKLSDPTALKLNHQIHLAPDIRGQNGTVTMQCRDCHAYSADMKTIEPIKFNKHCRSCHSLEFDERLPGNQVPHGDTDEVINYVFAEYAKLLLELEQKEAGTGRLRPGEPMKTKEQVEFARVKVQEQSRHTEDLLFTRTACHLCHQVSEKPEIVEGKSRFDIVKPQIPARWLDKAIFDHGAHQQVTCESCHQGMRESTLTTDLRLPKIKECRECHADVGGAGKVGSPCIQCHSYHDTVEFDDQKRRSIDAILKF